MGSKPIGGWLILWGVYFLVFEVLMHPMHIATAIVAFTQFDSAGRHFWSLVPNVVFWVWSLYIAFAFMQKRSSAPRHITWFLSATMLLELSQTARLIVGSDLDASVLIAVLVGSGAKCLVYASWLGYFLRSERVRETFNA